MSWPPKKCDVVRLAHHRRERAGEKRAILFAKRDRHDVGIVDHRVDDRILLRRILLRDRIEIEPHQKADGIDHVVVQVGQRDEIRLVIGGRARLQHLHVGAELRFGANETRDMPNR